MVRSSRALLGALLGASLLFAACTSAPVETPVPTASQTVPPAPTPRPTPTPTPTPEPTPTPIPLDESLLNRRVTVMVVGTDSNEDRASRGLEVNTDAILVVSVDATHSRVAMVGLPRDTVDLVMADGSTWTRKVNGMMRVLGIEALRGALAATYGVPIDHYVAIDMADFGRLVNAMGRVEVDVTQRLYDPPIGLDLQPGVHLLDGNNALRYVRTRVDSDYGRVARQQQMLEALVRTAIDPGTDIDFMALLRSFASVQTDIRPDLIPTFLEMARRSIDAEVSTQVLGPPRFTRFHGFDGARGWVMIPNIGEIRAYVAAVMGG